MRHLALFVLAAMAGFAAPAQAADCGKLTRVLTLDLLPAPAGGPRFGVGVTVNGTPRNFLLNTAGQATRLSRAAVTQLNLSPRSAGKMYSTDGSVTNAYIVLADLGIGSQVIKDKEMLVDENIGRFDGEYGPDMMQRYDIDLDFAARRLSYFTTDHCDGQVVYWTTSGITSVAFRGWTEHTDLPYLTIPVSVDGHEVLAVVNTALGQTTLEANTAHQLFDLTADSPGAVPLGTLDGNPSHRTFGYTFKTLQIGGVTLNNPRMQVIPDIVGTKSSETVRADSHIVRTTENKLPTVRLGIDVLRQLHIYIASKEQKLYLTLASDLAQRAVSGTPAAAQPANN